MSASVSTEELLEIGDRIIGWAGDDEEVEIVVAHEHETEVRAYDGEVEYFASATSRGAGIRVIKLAGGERRQGFAYAGSLDENILAETLADARDNAKFATSDEHLGLTAPDDVPYSSLDLFKDSLAEVSPEEKIELALRLERAVCEGDQRIIGVESADYADSISASAIVSTSGIRVAECDTSCHLTAFSIANADDDTQTGFGFSVGREPSELAVDIAAQDAIHRATRLLGAKKPHSQRMAVLLDPWVSAQLLGVVGATLSGDAVIRGRSLFADRLGEQIATELITLIDDPTNPEAFTAGEADGEGLATRQDVLVEGGYLKSFTHNSYTARRCATSSTASAVRGVSSTPGTGCLALSLLPGSLSQEELCQKVGEGVLVQSLFGLHSGVNPVSGDFSCGAEGLVIRDGATAEPLKEFTIASTIQKLLLNIAAVGNDLTWLPMRAAGMSLLIEDVTISGD